MYAKNQQVCGSNLKEKKTSKHSFNMKKKRIKLSWFKKIVLFQTKQIDFVARQAIYSPLPKSAFNKYFSAWLE